MLRVCFTTSAMAVALAMPALAGGQAVSTPPVPLVADDSEIGAYERDASPPAINTMPPRRIKEVVPIWPSPISERWRFRVHLVLDPTGKVAESRIVQTLVGDPAARPVGPHGDVAAALRSTPSARAGVAVLGAVRQWQFERPSRAPMLIVTDVGVEEADVAAGTVTASSTRGPVRIGGDIQPPRRLVNVPPDYPAEAIKARITGIVTIEAVISAHGDVSEARVISGVPGLDDAALAAVRQWKYTPTVVDGQAVPVVMTVSVNFSLSQ